MTATKYCSWCELTRPVEDFGRSSQRPDGLSLYCLVCNRARNKQYYRQSRARLGKPYRDRSWVPDGFWWCPICKQAVPVELYALNAGTSTGFGSSCRPCRNREQNEVYWTRRYGLSREAVELMRAEQGDECALCGDPHPAHLDHDHVTGVVRRLLCRRCNMGLGQFRDDPDLLRAAADYVEGHALATAGAVHPGYARWLAMTGRAPVDDPPTPGEERR